jgi:hypothetical protein
VFNSTFTAAPSANSGLAVTVAATGGCTILGSTVTMTSGTTDCTLTASQAGDADYSAASDVIHTVTATKAAQTITFASPATSAAFGASFSAGTPTASSGLAVTVAATGGCTILGSTVTMTSGTTDCTLTASQAGNADYSAASDVIHTVTATKAAQTITFASPATSAAFGTAFSVGTPTATSGLAVTVAATGGCTVLSGTATMTSGTTNCTLTASQAGNADYSAASDVIQTVTASRASQAPVTLTVPPSDSVDATGLMAIATGGSGTGSFSYSSTTLAVCSVDTGTGAIAALTVGTCSLTATRATDANYLAENSAVQSFSVTAGAATQLVLTTQPPTPPPAIIAGSNFSAGITALDRNGNVATGFTGAVDLATTGGGGGALFGTTSQPAVAGVASFTGNINVRTAGIGYKLVASSTGLTSGMSTAFDIQAAGANHLTFTTQPPSSVAAGATFGLAIELRDAFDNLKTNFDDLVTLSLASGTPGAILGGTLTGTTVGGVVTFTGLSIDLAGTGYSILASFPSGVPTATSSPVDVTP